MRHANPALEKTFVMHERGTDTNELVVNTRDAIVELWKVRG